MVNRFLRMLKNYNYFKYALVKYKRSSFNRKLNKGKLILVDERHRGIGKTTMMIELANKMDYGIVVGNQMTASSLLDQDKDLKIYRLAKNFTFELQGKDEKVLIDESVEPIMIEVLKSELPRIEICGGFIQNYGEEVK